MTDLHQCEKNKKAKPLSQPWLTMHEVSRRGVAGESVSTVPIAQELTRSVLQLFGMLFAVLLAEYGMRMLTGFPFSFRHTWVLSAQWTIVGLAYLFPRSATQSLLIRIFVSFLVISVFAVVRFCYVWHFCLPVATPVIIAPLLGICVFCIAAFLTVLPRALSVIGGLLFATVSVHFLSIWWANGFRQNSVWLVALQVVPFFVAIAALLFTDNWATAVRVRGRRGQTEKIENSHSPGAEEQDQSR